MVSSQHHNQIQKTIFGLEQVGSCFQREKQLHLGNTEQKALKYSLKKVQIK